MKSIFMAAIVLFATSPLFAGGNTAARKASYERRKKQENAKCAAKYAKQSKQFLNAKLNECNAKASPEVRAEAEKEVALKKKMGNLLQQLSTAYKNSDMEAVKKLRNEAQKTYYSEKKKKRGGAPCKSKKSKSLKP
ncbi:MAG: hypothetical protein GXP32_09855 [Kiritimatiellaeota bacterium]|nr:hypothetical protein [Kiritimatiellota bacterium]